LDADAIQNPIISRPAPWKLTPLTLDQRALAGARCVRKRHGAEAITGLRRGAGRQQPAREFLAAGIGRGEQRRIELNRDHVGLDEIELALELAAGRGLYGLRGRGYAQAGQHQAGNGSTLSENQVFAIHATASHATCSQSTLNCVAYAEPP
jgi:hypothetical protein